MRAKPNDTTPAAGSAKQRGDAAETLAAEFLVARGLRLLQRNFRVRGGEIDLVCLDGKTLVFVEVRLRSRGDFGDAAASITAGKRRRIILAARHYLQGREDCPVRFDCVLLDTLDPARLEWLRNAFDADA